MPEVEFTFNVETPMFCGRGGNRGDTFRITELRSLLRFTLRALLVSSVSSPAELHRLETQLFGQAAANDHDSIAASPVAFRPTRPLPDLSPNSQRASTPTGRPSNFDRKHWAPAWLIVKDSTAGLPFYPVAYILGQGLMEITRDGPVLTRSYLPAGSKVHLAVTAPSDNEDEFASTRTLSELVFVASQLFGIGARTRRGFGRFSCSGQSYIAHLPGYYFMLPFREVLPMIRQRLLQAARLTDGQAIAAQRDTPALDENWLHRHFEIDQDINRRNGWQDPQTPTEALRYVGLLLRTLRAPIEREAPRDPRPGYALRTTTEYASKHEADRFFESAAYGLPASIKGIGSNSTRRPSPIWLAPTTQPGQPLSVFAHKPPATFLNDPFVELRHQGRVEATATPAEIDQIHIERVFTS